MDEFTQWLRAQLDEDERIARAASGNSPWRTVVRGGLDFVEGDGWTVCNASETDAAHIAEHDPARALREIDAKRRRLDRHQPERRRLYLLDANGGTTSFAFYVCTACTPNRTIEHGQDVIEWPCPEVRDGAAVYAERPGYREEWQP